MFSKSLSKKICLTLAVCFILNIFNIAIVFARNSEPTIIRVGYSKNYGVIKDPIFDGFEGYGYEFLHKIADYTDGNYQWEFVLCNWADRFDALITGEVDIFLPATIIPEYDDIFVYTNNKFADESVILNSATNYYFKKQDYDNFNNVTIGLRTDGTLAPYLQEFLDYNNLSPTLIETGNADFSTSIAEHSYDYLLTRSLQMDAELNVALTLATYPTYISALSENAHIIEDIDLAISRINNHEYLFRDKLYFKYFDYDTSNNQFITQADYDLIQSRDTYNVGVINMYPTFGYDAITNIHNVSVDVMGLISSQLGFNVNLVEISPTTTKDELDLLDFYIHLNGYKTDLFDNFSDPYMQDNLLFIQNSNLISTNNIGVLDYYGFTNEFITSMTSVDDIYVYTNIRALVDDFNAGTIDSLVMSNSVYELIYTLLKNTPHKGRDLDYPILPVIIFTDDFPLDKIHVINKAISYITEQDIDSMVLNNTTKVADVERSYMYLQYFYTLAVTIFAIGCVVAYFKYNKAKEIERIASIDKLSGLYTQKKFIAETNKLLANNKDINYAMFCFDIDNFKFINELYTFEVGDKILAEIGEFCRTASLANLPASRLSSDHFIVVGIDDGKADHVEILLQTSIMLREQINKFIDSTYSMDFSIGYYAINDRSIHVEKMIDYCNLARSYSKDELGTHVSTFSESMNQKVAVKNDIIFRMNNALKDKEFVLYYQPKFDIETQKIVGAEALVRWFSNGKMMPPNDFIPLFEKNGFIEKLDYYVLDTTCEFISQNRQKNIPVISVNISSITIMKNDIVEKILSIVAKHDLIPSNLELEITESAFVDQFDIALERINNLRASGFGISMDDFGTGVSSLGRLKNMTIDVLKIDREFIIETLKNDKSDVILESIIKMANKLDLETIAEGIETQEQLSFLKTNGCNVGQGYYFARPLPASDFLALLQ